MEDSTWIAHGFLAALPCTSFWISEKPDEILVSLGQIWILSSQTILSQDEVEVQTPLSILQWWSCEITSKHSHYHKWLSVQLSYPPSITSLNFRTGLAAKSMGCHMHLLPHPPFSHFADPPDCIILCSSVPDSTPILNEDQAINRVGVAQPT